MSEARRRTQAAALALQEHWDDCGICGPFVANGSCGAVGEALEDEFNAAWDAEEATGILRTAALVLA